MTIKSLDAKCIADFTAYCRAHRADVDDSFLYEEDLNAFQPGEENPTAVAWEDGRIVAVASILCNEYMRLGNRARFRIFHCEDRNASTYAALLQAVLPLVSGAHYLDCYAHQQDTPLRAALEAQHFVVERQSHLLQRKDLPVGEVLLPDGFTIAAYAPGADAAAWCAVRNVAFATLKGSETPITEEMADRRNASAIPGGAMVLRFGPQAVGVVRADEDDIDGSIANIGPLAIAPDCQGRGFGRMLLRAALQNAKNQGYSRAVLCVNDENTRATALYLQEGFEIVETVVCYRYDFCSEGPFTLSPC